jgi:amino acid transporter
MRLVFLSTQKKLFLRDATGLIRAWSTYDSFVYSALSINIVTLAWFIFPSGTFFPQGNLITAVIVSGIFIFFEVVTYAMLIAVMPRAGGDYVWQSRVLTGSIGFILAFTGYVFILWQWGPIYGNILSVELAAPVAAVLGNPSAAIWWSGANGIFASSILTIILVSIFISLGMKWYARIQKWSFHIGMVGLIVVLAILAASSQSSFQASFDSFTGHVFGNSTAYQSSIQLASAGGLAGQSGVTDWNFMPSLALIPVVVFFNPYVVWGATLYGEVRGSNDLKKNLRALTTSLIFTTVLCVVTLLLFANTFGWNFYNSANYVYLGTIYGYNPSSAPLPIFPYPALLAGMITHNLALQLFILITMSFWYWGWAGTLFMSSTRVLFAASFDRILPSMFADVNVRLRSPLNAIIAMAIPTAIFSYLYSYVTVGGLSFTTFVLDAALVIVVMSLGTAITAAVLPYRRKALYESSPISGYKVGGVPVITIAGVTTALFFVAVLWAWAVNPTYGVNNIYSATYVLILYIIAAVLYFGFKVYRKKQGFEMDKIYAQIPVE